DPRRSRISACHAHPRVGLSMTEALVALSVMSMAGAVRLHSAQSSLGTTIQAVDQTIADGVAQQTLHEILTKRYTSSSSGNNPLNSVLGPLCSKLLGPGTSLFTELGDYAGYVAQPLKGTYGETLGTGDDNGNLRLQNFR